MNEIKVEWLRLDELKQYENNPRDVEAAVDPVAESIKQFGFKVPIVIDEENVIVAGHTRFAAATKIGLDEVPCIRTDGLTSEQVRAYRLADNKTAELAEWDHEALEFELDDLDKVFDLSLFGFEPKKSKKEKHTEKPGPASAEEYIVCPRCGKQIRRWKKDGEHDDE